MKAGGGKLEVAGTDCNSSIVSIHAKEAVRRDIICVDFIENKREELLL